VSLFFFTIAAAVVGLLAGWLMHGLMLLLSRRHEVPVNFVEALGSYHTRARGPRARRIGWAAHSLGGIVLGIAYAWLLRLMGFSPHPGAIILGAALGFFHGLLVSYLLMYWLAEEDAPQRYQGATMVVGGVHLVGHIFFGAVMGTYLYLAHGLAS
jgi:hypothetical protein